ADGRDHAAPARPDGDGRSLSQPGRRVMTMAGPERDVRPDVDPITVEVIGNALASIVEEMGETLVRAAYSTNVKERRDSSTGLFDARGRTLCQAMHIPMHLGSLMGVVEH